MGARVSPFGLASALAMAVAAPAAPQAQAPPAARLTAQEMMALTRISDPQVSPDGKWVAYAAVQIDAAANTRNSDLWLVPTAGDAAPRRLTDHASSDSRPRWSRDGRRLAFVSSRDGGSQVYVLDLPAGAPHRVTSLATGAGGVLWIDAATLLVTSDVYAECNRATAGGMGAHDEACNKKLLDAAGKQGSARVYDHLLLRHWDTWEDQRRTHLLATLARPDQQTLVTATGMEDFDAPFLARARKIRVEGARLYPS